MKLLTLVLLVLFTTSTSAVSTQQQSAVCEVFDTDRSIESIRAGDRVFRRPGAWMWQYGPGNNFVVSGETVPGGMKATVLSVEPIPESRRAIYSGGKLWVTYLPDRQRELLHSDVAVRVDPLCFEPGGDPTSNGWATSDLSGFRLLKPKT